MNEQKMSRLSENNNKLYRRRWIILLFYNIAALVNTLPFQICVPISSSLSTIYGVSSFNVTLAATLFMLMHPLLSFPASQLITTYGWATSTNIGIMLTLVGCASRLLINKVGFIMVIIGQILCGMGRPFIFNAQASFAMHWFAPKSRILIISLLTLMNTLGMVLSVWIPGSIIFKNYDTHLADVKEGKKLGEQLMQLELYISLISLPGLFILKSNPPNFTKHITIHQIKGSFKTNMISLAKNVNFMLVVVPFSIYFGILKALLVILEQLMHPYGYSQEQVAMAESVPLIIGLIAQASLPYFINKSGTQKKSTAVLLGIATIFVALMFFAIMSKQVYLIYLDLGILGFAVMPIIPIMMDVSCDLVYPIDISFAIGAMYMFATILMVIIAQTFSLLLSDVTTTRIIITMIVLTICCTICLILFLFVKLKPKHKHSIVSVEDLLINDAQGHHHNENDSVGFAGDVPTFNLEEDQVNEEGYEEEYDQEQDQEVDQQQDQKVDQENSNQE